jgi:glycosyltransferase involved in cell wall biosynthesis
MSAASLVSVVIPTLKRPELLLRALQSVLAQTHANLEAIVVVDGPDEPTLAALASVHDPRLTFFANPRSLTAAGARNAGVARATGDWVAFLDDDDEWLPTKLEKQLALAAGRDTVIASCLTRVETPLTTYIWPEIVYDNAVPLGDYLFDRKTAFLGASFIQSSGYLLPRALFLASPFRVGSPHDDWEFILRLCSRPGVRVETVPEALVMHRFEEQRATLSSRNTWAESLAWIDSLRPILTRRAYSGFVLGVVGPRAAGERAFSAFVPLLVRAFRHGAPRPLQVAVYLAFWTVPQDFRRRLRARLRTAALPRAGRCA